MLKKLFRFAQEDDGNIAVDWVVLAAGVVSLSLAITLAVAHNSKVNAAPETTVVASND